MNPYTAVLAQKQLEQLRADAAEQRLARTARAGRRSRFVATFSSLLTPVSSSESHSGVVPKLSDYPYRG